MHAEGIYVEISIDAPMDELWEHTQNPRLHEQWDLRFTTIEYLPKESEEEPQRFLYATRIGFGIAVSGMGESAGTRHTADGQYTSALKFWSDEPISLIESGSGYWKYIPDGEAVRFLTWYDYQVRFGAFGRLVDRLVFRPLIGWATAWSFDALRLWLERDLHPAGSIRRTATRLVAHVSVAAIWIYQGLVSTQLLPAAGAMATLAGTLFGGTGPALLAASSVAQVAFGLLFLVPRRSHSLHYLHIAVLFALGVGAVLTGSFNSVGLIGVLIVLSLVSVLNTDDVPDAGNCLRRPRDT